MYQELNFNTKCRSCLAEDQEMHHLFMEFDQGLKLSDILKNTTSFEVEENDGSSPYLCESCTTTVVEFFNFKTIYLENENYMKSLFDHKNEFDDFKIVYTTESSNDDTHEELENSPITEEHLIEINPDEEKQLGITGEFVEAKDIIKQNVKTFQFFCEQCDESFLLKSEFKQHMLKTHTVEVSEFSKEIDVPKVVKLEIEDENIILQCDTCNEKFKTYADIEEHCKSHKKYVCEHCGAGFLKKSYLNDHAEVHTSEKRHVCPLCGKAFRRRTVLVKHKRIHTHPMQCVCEICGLRYTDKGTLKTHIKLKHIKERNFNCTICGLWFPLKSTLLKHIYRHNEDRKKEFVCKTCNMAYKDKSSLNRHVMIKHTENPEKPSCSFCGKQYTTKTNLLKHVRKHHKLVHFEKDLEDDDEIDDC